MDAESYMPYGFCDVRVWNRRHDTVAKDRSHAKNDHYQAVFDANSICLARRRVETTKLLLSGEVLVNQKATKNEE